MTAAAGRLISGEPPINFAAHQIRAGNIAGAREDFEQMIALLVGATRPSARLIAANPGDWGIDVLVGDLSGSVAIWQAKYFWPMVTQHSRGAIRESFRSALSAADRNGYRVHRWFLCTPSSMDGPTAKWWDSWRERNQRSTGVRIELWHETVLRALLTAPDATHVRRHYYDPYAPDAVVSPRSVLDPVEQNPDALFVRQLREAGHVELAAARREFFNAELMAAEIAVRRVPAELAALADADALAHGIWEARFNAAIQAHPVAPRLPGLHQWVTADLRETAGFSPLLRAGPVQRCGLVHRVVDTGRAGWVTYWREVAREHAAGGRP